MAGINLILISDMRVDMQDNMQAKHKLHGHVNYKMLKILRI